MSKALLLVVGIVPLSAFAEVDCTDLRAAFIQPCKEKNERHFFVRGECKKSYEFESVYCAIPGEPVCTDSRAVTILPCEDGSFPVLVKGQCSKSYEFEHHFCRS